MSRSPAKRVKREDEHRVRGNQPGQARFLADLAEGATAYVGGLGSGKTWAAARKLLYLHALNRCPGLAVAPTYGDLWRFVVPAIVAACDELAWECTIHPSGHGASKFPHVMVEGFPILTLSAEDPERFAGFEVGHVWVDEAARIKESRDNPLRDAPTQIRSRLRHPAAKRLALIVSTTPEGTDTWVHRDFSSPKALPHHRAYHGSTRYNSALPPSYIEALRAALPADLATQYIDGHAVDYSANRAHPTFHRDRHLAPGADFTRGAVHVGADFNVSPLCWLAAQQTPDGGLVVLDELVLDDFGLVDQATQMAHDKGWNRWGPVHLHPDRSGHNRNRIGDTEVATITKTARALGWDLRCDAFGANPPVNPRINLVSRMLVDGSGKVRLRVAPRCKRLIDELATTGRKSSGYDPGPSGKRGHILDALGYLVFDLYAPQVGAFASNLGLK